MKKRTVLILAALLLLFGLTVVIWELADWPPPRLILKYGFPPAGGPTGARRQHPGGLEFVELSEGYCRSIPGPFGRESVDLWRRLLIGVGLSKLTAYEEKFESDRSVWVEVPRRIWLSANGVTLNTVRALRAESRRPTLVDYEGRPLRLDDHMAACLQFWHKEVCRCMAELHDGGYRLPSVEEWHYATVAGVLRFEGLASEAMVVGSSYRQRPVLDVADQLSSSAAPRAQSFRLVWIPPEDTN